jgi:hypothetical protein
MFTSTASASASEGLASDLIVTPQTVETAGAISYWRLSGNVALGKLAAEWAARGLDADLLPSQPEDQVALGRAVRELQRKRRRVFPLARRGAWVVKDETVSSDNKDVSHTRVCTITYDNGQPVIEAGEVSAEEFEAARVQVMANFRLARVELAPEDITVWLVGLARDQLAVGLRDSGGVYFIPRAGVEFWGKVVESLHAASSHRIFRIPALKNSEAIDAIVDAVTLEAAREMDAIERDLTAEGDDALGARALQTRAATTETLLGKAAAYESYLGVKLDTLRSKIEGLQASIAAAALKVDSDEDAAA